MPLQLDDFLQPGAEASEVARRSGGDPLGLGQRGGARQLFDQGARQADAAVVAAAQSRGRSRRPVSRVSGEIRVLDDRQKLADLRIGRPLVVQAGEQAHLGRAMACAAVGHERLLVPSQQGRARAQEGLLSGATDQFGVSFVGVHGHDDDCRHGGVRDQQEEQNGNLFGGQGERQAQVRLLHEFVCYRKL